MVLKLNSFAGIFIGTAFSFMQFIDMGSTRNLIILGIAINFGFLLPSYFQRNTELKISGDLPWEEYLLLEAFVTTSFSCCIGNRYLNTFIIRFFSTPHLVASLTGGLLDNIVPG